MHSLPLFHRVAGQPVIVVGKGEAAAAKSRIVERAGGRVVDLDDPTARLAFVALDDPEAVVVALKARGVLVNVVDRPELCDFTTPSLLERGSVLVAVATGGASAGLAKALRLRLEALLPASLGTLADALAAARAVMKKRWPDAGVRRRALDAALGEGGPLDLLSGRTNVADWIDGREESAMTTHEVLLHSVDPDELTLRQARWLGSADLVAHEPGVPAAILDRARADAVRLELTSGEAAPAHSGLVVVIRSAPAGS